MSGKLVLTLEFHPLARRPDIRRLGRRWDIHVVIDGTDHRFEEGPRHEMEVSAGTHNVEVYFTGAGFQFLAGLLGIRYGRRSTQVAVEEGETANLRYKGGMFWHMGGGSLFPA